MHSAVDGISSSSSSSSSSGGNSAQGLANKVSGECMLLHGVQGSRCTSIGVQQLQQQILAGIHSHTRMEGRRDGSMYISLQLPR